MYLELFRDSVNLPEQQIKKINKNINYGDIFWLIPIKRDKRINTLVSILEFSFLNSFMQWPDKHNFLSSIDLEIRKI